MEAVEAHLEERSLAAAESLFLPPPPFPTTMVAAVSRAVSQFCTFHGRVLVKALANQF